MSEAEHLLMCLRAICIFLFVSNLFIFSQFFFFHWIVGLLLLIGSQHPNVGAEKQGN